MADLESRILASQLVTRTMQLNQPLSNTQIELLKLFSHTLSEHDLLLLRRTLAKFFADLASDEMDSLWSERGWSNETMEQWLQEGAKTDAQG